MEKKLQPRDEAYIKYLADLVDDDLVDSAPKLIRRNPASPVKTPAAKSSTKWIYVAGALLVLGLMGLIVREVLWPRATFDGDSQEFAKLQQEVHSWSLSGVKSIALPMLKKRIAAEAQWQPEDSEFLGKDRWRIWGTVQSTDSAGTDWQSKWETQVEYSPETTSGDILKVLLDGAMIYSR